MKMKMLVTGDLSYYGGFEVNKIYDIKMGRALLNESDDIIFINDKDESEDGVLFIYAGKYGDEYIEYQHIEDRVIIFKDDIELAHYLIDNKEGFAESIVKTAMIFQK